MNEDLYDLIGGRNTIKAATDLFYNNITSFCRMRICGISLDE
jgi:truncated hemoglobin YjbI